MRFDEKLSSAHIRQRDRKVRTVVLSSRVRGEIGGYAKGRTVGRDDAPLIASQRNGRAFSTVSLSMLFKEIYELAGIEHPRIQGGGRLPLD